jgi:hypothetical protein
MQTAPRLVIQDTTKPSFLRLTPHLRWSSHREKRIFLKNMEQTKESTPRENRRGVEFRIVDGPLVTLFKRIARRQRRKQAERKAASEAALPAEPGTTKVLSVRKI